MNISLQDNYYAAEQVLEQTLKKLLLDIVKKIFHLKCPLLQKKPEKQITG